MKNKLRDPHFQLKFHFWATILWFIAAFPICIFLSQSIPFLVFISVYAVVTGHWASWQAARTEVLQAGADEKMMMTVQHIEETLDRVRSLDKEAPFTDN